MPTTRTRTERRRTRRRLRQELKQLDKTGQPSEWLLAQCAKKSRHHLRARVLPGLKNIL